MLNPMKFNLTIRMMLILLIALSCGCYPDWPEHSGTAVVHGRVLLDGSTLTQAKIVFIPKSLRDANGRLMPLAYGFTDMKGKFELVYSDGTKEILAGRYTVMISNVKQVNGENGETREPWRSTLLPDSVAGLITFSEYGETIPVIYNRNSKLTYEITASPSIVRPKFELTSIDPELIKLYETESSSK